VAESRNLTKAARVRLLCVDVDGVLTDAGMYDGPDGDVTQRRGGDGAVRELLIAARPAAA
jgi:3-deoxy-D-manno-octulosonate 8-phosphate phosphatase KdsC-like HAD superfamily phosphatase